MRELLKIDEAIKSGLAFLAKNQEADGSFISFSSASDRPFRRLRSWQTVFVPALMLTSLSSLDESAALSIRKKLSNFLLAQKEDDWSFNYWSKSAPEYTSQPYPNDLDDTFCALVALYQHDAALINAAALAKIVKLLLATEAVVGGPYRTWLVPADSSKVWTDVDVAVNSNIAYFLSLTGNRLSKLDSLIEQSIAKSSFSSPYYPSQYAFIYYFARAYRGPMQKKLLSKIRRLQKETETDLDKALCLSARLQLGDTQGLRDFVGELLKGQRRDGSWPAAVFYADPVKNNKLYYNGAPALTTAFVLESLKQYKIGSIAGAAKETPKLQQTINMSRITLDIAKQQCRGLNKELRLPTLETLKRIANSNNGFEITNVAWRFNQSLKKPAKLPDKFIETLGLANLYGWTAYTIYDDFLDGEGEPELISVANVALRRSLDCFSGVLPDNSKFQQFIRQTFDTIDGANAWELARCRFEVKGSKLMVGKTPDYGNSNKLAERSMGHALPLLAVLAAKGLEPADAAYRQTMRAFEHYLIARQLNDDAHDWVTDLQNGHITPVVAMLLTELKIKPREYDMAELIYKARKQFWLTALQKVCQQMTHHVQLSRRCLSRSGLLKTHDVISELLDGIEESIKDTLVQQNQATDFLKHYNKKDKKVVQL